MNVFHFSCRNFRSLGLLMVTVIGLYVLLNVIYIALSGAVSAPADAADGDLNSLMGRLKFGRPDADGKVEVVVSLDVKQLVQLLGNNQLEGLFRDAGTSGISTKGQGGSPPMNVSYVLHNPSLCSSSTTTNLEWIAVINSAPENGAQRSLLRETWADVGLFQRDYARTVFVLGRSNDVAVQLNVEAEFQKYKDILQGDFVDVSRNATLKGILALHYVSEFCQQAKYFIKTNDDTFLNIFEMMQIMRSASLYPHSVICPLWKENTMPILRDPKDCMEWCVAPNELPGLTHFPQYCAGLAFILSQSLVPLLYKATVSTPFFWIDDVYMTGLLLPNIPVSAEKIHFVDLINNFTLVDAEAEQQYTDTNKPMKFPIAKIRDAGTFRKVWLALLHRLPASQYKLLSNAAMARGV